MDSNSFTYDANGDVITINDLKTGNPQTQTFTYDALDRLSSAVASGGTYGDYALQNYTYNASTWILTTNLDTSLTYADADRGHAVTALTVFPS